VKGEVQWDTETEQRKGEQNVSTSLKPGAATKRHGNVAKSNIPSGHLTLRGMPETESTGSSQRHHQYHHHHHHYRHHHLQHGRV